MAQIGQISFILTGRRLWPGVSVAILLWPAQAGSQAPTIVTGAWGGPHARLAARENGAEIELDCAHGLTSEPLWIDAGGRFETRGVFVKELGGPGHIDDPPPREHPAIYSGQLDGGDLRLRIHLIETGLELGPFDLALDAAPLLEKCL